MVEGLNINRRRTLKGRCVSTSSSSTYLIRLWFSASGPSKKASKQSTMHARDPLSQPANAPEKKKPLIHPYSRKKRAGYAKRPTAASSMHSVEINEFHVFDSCCTIVAQYYSKTTSPLPSHARLNSIVCRVWQNPRNMCTSLAAFLLSVQESCIRPFQVSSTTSTETAQDVLF